MEGIDSPDVTRLKSRATHPLIGRIIAERFQIASFIGDGRIAQVFCAQQLDETRHVALKVVLPAFTGDQDVVGRFLFAAEKCRRLRHDNIVPLHAAGEDRDVLYLATDLVVGETLRSAIDARGPMLEAESIRIVTAIAEALEHALGLGVLHRGLRPTNVLLTRRAEAPELEVVRVCDFGMGDVVEALRARDPYAAPERMRGEPSTPAVDVYALGAMLFELLTGRGFRREKPQDAVMAVKRERQHHSQRPAPIRPGTLRLLERSLELDPRERFPSVRELRAELATMLRPPSAAPASTRPSKPPSSARPPAADTVPGRVVSAGSEQSLIGRTLDGAFRVVSYMRSGGMANLYYGTRVDQSERIVIKLLHPRLCEEPEIIERFTREARIAAQLVHPNIVEIVHVGDQYFVMELVAGDDLARRLRQRGRLPEAQAAQIGIEVSRALAYAHSRRVVHRDIKPANIMIHADESGIEQVKLLDFGIAKLLDNTRNRVVSADLTRNRSALTSVGDLIGTPRYMSPEQGRAEGIDRRSDLYSLGIVLYELLTGFVPFDGETALQIVARHVQDEPRPPRDLAPDLSAELERLVLQLLSKDPAARPASANEVEERLTAMLPELGHARSTSTNRWLSRDIDAAAAAVDWDAEASRIYIPAVTPPLAGAERAAMTPSPGSTTEPATAPSAVTGEHDRMVSLRRLADGVADKLDDALAAILGFSSLISDALRLGDPLLDDVSQISRAAERAAAMRDQLLAFSGRQPMSPCVLDLHAWVSSMEPSIRRMAGDAMTVEVHLEPGEAYVEADPRKLEQAVLNLVANAKDATNGRGALTIESAVVSLPSGDRSMPPLPYALIGVSDNGCGMTSEVAERAFEPFFSTKPRGAGDGLGLAVVHGIAEQSGGFAAAFSREGGGTEVQIHLPLVSPPTEEKPPGSVRTPVEETVLVVEEEALMRAFIRATLGRAGYRVIEASSGEEALHLARRHPGPIHLVITNVQSPRVDGRELVRALGVDRPSLAAIYASSSTLSPLQVPAGAQWLRKPIAPDSLLATVKTALGRGV